MMIPWKICRAVLALSQTLQAFRFVWMPSTGKKITGKMDLKMIQPGDVQVFKYYKPVGAVSATLPDVEDNIILRGNLSAQSKALFEQSKFPIVPIGRLDKGILILI